MKKVNYQIELEKTSLQEEYQAKTNQRIFQIKRVYEMEIKGL
jgi:hypothetical protein